MSWDKRIFPGETLHYPGRMEVEYYLYTPGIHGLEAAKLLKEGKVPGMRCPDGRLFMPPKTFCPDTLEEAEIVEVEGPFILSLYTVVRESLRGERLGESVVLGFITSPGVIGGYIGVVKGPEEKIRPGIVVRPVFRPEHERTGAFTDIAYWSVEG